MTKPRPAELEADFERLKLAIDLVDRARVQLQALSPEAHADPIIGMAGVLQTTLWSALENPWGWHGASAAPSSSSSPPK